MRLLRGISTTVAMVVTLSVIPFAGTAAAADPTAPFDAFTVVGDGWNSNYDPTNARFTITPWGKGFRLDAWPNGGGPHSEFSAMVQPNYNQPLNLGTWRTDSSPGSSVYQLQMLGNGGGCLGHGSITIHEFTQDQTRSGKLRNVRQVQAQHSAQGNSSGAAGRSRGTRYQQAPVVGGWHPRHTSVDRNWQLLQASAG